MQQSNSLDFKLVQRVCLLQQALDQALESLAELTAQVQDKYWVETQLASTEKYANVQQQAITHLKQQLAQFTEIQNHLLGVMSFRLDELIDQQQQAFGQLNIQFQRSHTELQTYLRYLTHHQQPGIAERGTEAYYRALEAEVMVARSMAVHLSQYLGLTKQHLDHLHGDLGNHHLNLGHMIKTIQAMIADLAQFDHAQAQIQLQDSEPKAAGLACSLVELAIAEAKTPDIDTLQATTRRQEARIQELQAVVDECLDHETQLRQRFQEVAAERDYYRRELEKLQQAPPCQSLATTPKGPDPEAAQRSRYSQPIQPLRLPET